MTLSALHGMKNTFYAQYFRNGQLCEVYVVFVVSITRCWPNSLIADDCRQAKPMWLSDKRSSCDSPFNFSMEGTLLKCIFHKAHNARNSKDVDALKFHLVHHDTFYNGENQQDSTECLLLLINIIQKGSMPDSCSTTYPMGASLSDILFSFFGGEIYIVCDVCGLRSPPHLNLVVFYVFQYFTSWYLFRAKLDHNDCNRNCKYPVLGVIKALGTSNQARYHNLQNTCFSSLIDLDTLTIMSPKIDAPYLWIRPLGLVPLNLAYGLF